MPSRERILESRAEIVQAARNFGDLAGCLGARLAARLGLTTTELSRGRFVEPGIPPGHDRGSLGRGWRYVFHGFQVWFRHRGGLELDVELGFPDEFGVLDPWFFAEFVAVTPRSRHVSRLVAHLGPERRRRLLATLDTHAATHALIQRDWGVASRVLTVLEHEGDLVRVAREAYPGHADSGLVPREPVTGGAAAAAARRL